MIRKEQVMTLFLVACPSFNDRWEEYRANWGDEYLLYLDLAELANHVIDLHTRNEVGELWAVFDVAERLHIEGDDYVKEAATIGFLEGLQNSAENTADEYARYLKPESAKWWRQLNLFWDGEIPFVGATLEK